MKVIVLKPRLFKGDVFDSVSISEPVRTRSRIGVLDSGENTSYRPKVFINPFRRTYLPGPRSLKGLNVNSPECNSGYHTEMWHNLEEVECFRLKGTTCLPMNLIMTGSPRLTLSGLFTMHFFRRFHRRLITLKPIRAFGVFTQGDMKGTTNLYQHYKMFWKIKW